MLNGNSKTDLSKLNGTELCEMMSDAHKSGMKETVDKIMELLIKRLQTIKTKKQYDQFFKEQSNEIGRRKKQKGGGYLNSPGVIKLINDDCGVFDYKTSNRDLSIRTSILYLFSVVKEVRKNWCYTSRWFRLKDETYYTYLRDYIEKNTLKKYSTCPDEIEYELQRFLKTCNIISKLFYTLVGDTIDLYYDNSFYVSSLQNLQNIEDIITQSSSNPLPYLLLKISENFEKNIKIQDIIDVINKTSNPYDIIGMITYNKNEVYQTYITKNNDVFWLCKNGSVTEINTANIPQTENLKFILLKYNPYKLSSEEINTMNEASDLASAGFVELDQSRSFHNVDNEEDGLVSAGFVELDQSPSFDNVDTYQNNMDDVLSEEEDPNNLKNLMPYNPTED